MSTKKITRLPENDKTNGWSRLLAPRMAKPALGKDIQADWVIVGGGLAGLAAARRLAENRPDDSIVVLEADQVGEGAQGRNSGFAIDSPHNVGSSMGELDAARSHAWRVRQLLI
ncbi:FAD-dependent oxidoreductase [Alcaligenes aquatilis]|uniref:FAD-dependent oxidoreductase n=1 Tax=Alcaligenes aquatilis TaxID=323284 RepID=UPI003873B3FD